MRRLLGQLELGRKGILILIADAERAWIRRLVSALDEVDPESGVLLDPRDIRDCPEGGVVLWVVDLDYAAWININRPLFAGRRVVLWAEGDTSLGLRRQAPDFFDWISHVHHCPPGIPEFARRGLEVGWDWRPGIAWFGDGLMPALIERSDEVVRVSAVQDYENLVAVASLSLDQVVVWEHVETSLALWRVRWAIAESGFTGLSVLADPLIDSPGWFPVRTRVGDWDTQVTKLRTAQRDRAAKFVAYAELEAEAVEALEELGALDDAAISTLKRDGVDGVLRGGQMGAELDLSAIAELRATAPWLRAMHRDQRVASWRSKVAEDSVEALSDEGAFDPVVSRWALALTIQQRAQLEGPLHGLAHAHGFAIVQALAETSDGEGPRYGAARALGRRLDPEVAKYWARRAAELGQASAGDDDAAVDEGGFEDEDMLGYLGGLGELVRLLGGSARDLRELDRQDLGTKAFTRGIGLFMGLVQKRAEQYLYLVGADASRFCMFYAYALKVTSDYEPESLTAYADHLLTSAEAQLGRSSRDFGRILRVTGVCMAVLASLERAEPYLREAYAIEFTYVGRCPGLWSTLLPLAHVLVARAKSSEARRRLEPMLEISGEGGECDEQHRGRRLYLYALGALGSWPQLRVLAEQWRAQGVTLGRASGFEDFLAAQDASKGSSLRERVQREMDAYFCAVLDELVAPVEAALATKLESARAARD